MTINELVSNLIEKTKKDELTWESQGGSLYRLITSNGSIVLEESYLVPGKPKYTIRLYDKDSCFATYQSALNNQNDILSILYKEISAYNNRLIENKIQNIFGSI